MDRGLGLLMRMNRSLEEARVQGEGQPRLEFCEDSYGLTIRPTIGGATRGEELHCMNADASDLLRSLETDGYVALDLAGGGPSPSTGVVALTEKGLDRIRYRRALVKPAPFLREVGVLATRGLPEHEPVASQLGGTQHTGQERTAPGSPARARDHEDHRVPQRRRAVPPRLQGDQNLLLQGPLRGAPRPRRRARGPWSYRIDLAVAEGGVPDRGRRGGDRRRRRQEIRHLAGREDRDASIYAPVASAGSHRARFLSIAPSIVSSFRMQAVSATFFGLPLARNLL